MIRKHCAAVGLPEPVMLDEPLGTSGRSVDFRHRTEGRWLLLHAQAGDVLVVTKLDRLGRTAKDSEMAATSVRVFRGREAAQLDSPGQRPGTKAEATQHKAQWAVAPWRRESRPVGPWNRITGTRSPRPPAWAVGFGPVGAVTRPGSPKRSAGPTQRCRAERSGPSTSSDSPPAEQKRYQKIAAPFQKIAAVLAAHAV